jgi:tetratricopeptide (TPR) repeat protein
VAELRKRIPDGDTLISTDSGGYRLTTGDRDVDLACFTADARHGKDELDAGRAAEGIRTLTTALELWRGPVLLGCGGRVIDEYAAALEELRLGAAERLIDARLDLGDMDELAGYIRSLIAQHPLREGLRLRLMQTLGRTGRSAEALVEYQRTCEILAEELGTDPGAALRRLHVELLTGAATPATAPAPAPEPVPVFDARPTAVCTLPYDPADFTGRDPELAGLLAGRLPHGEGNPRVVAIDGMGGCGKTSLAVRAAHRLARSYPDGQLYIDMHGFSPNEPPRDPDQATSALLRQLGVPDERIPVRAEDSTALWRATLRDRRVLIVLDNVADCAQVRPLLPASGTCMVILTSRVRLANLDGAELLSLAPLIAVESFQLVERVLGTERVAAEPEAVAKLCAFCGHIPLALRIATARLRSRPNWSVRHLVDRLDLEDEAGRLDELVHEGRSIASTLQLSYRALESDRRSAFLLLPQHPADEFDAASVAALFGLRRAEAEDILDALLDVRLLEQPEFGRYALHDLVRAFALGEGARAAADEGPDRAALASSAAVERLLGYYEYVASQACALLYGITPPADAPSAPPGPPRAPATVEEAADWFEREWATLMAVVERAENSGMFDHCVRLARYLAHHLNDRSRLTDFERVAGLAVTAARMAEEPEQLRISLANLAVARWKLGRLGEGLAAAREALELARRLADPRGEAICLGLAGLFESCLGRLEIAETLLRRALELHRIAGERAQAVYALVNISTTLTWLGRYEEAADTAAEAVRLSTEIGVRGARLSALNDLAIARLALGQEAAALHALADALAEPTAEYLPETFALALALAAEANQRLGDTREAERCMRESRRLLLVGGLSVRQTAVENVLGTVSLLRGEYSEALALFQSAHRHATTFGYRIEISRASAGISAALTSVDGGPGHADPAGTAPGTNRELLGKPLHEDRRDASM